MKKRNEIKKIFGITLAFMMIFSVVAGISLAAEQSGNTGDSRLDAVTDANTVSRNTDEAYIQYGWISGYTTEQDGNLVSGVYLRLDKIVPTISSEAYQNYVDYEPSYVVYSDEEGYFYSLAKPGVYTLEARKKGYSEYSGTSIVVTANEGTEVNIALEEVNEINSRAGKLHGIVYGTSSQDASGTISNKYPLSGAMIIAISENAATIENTKITYTDADGKYELVLPIGTYRVTASIYGNPIATDVVSATEGKYTQSVIVTIEALVTELDFLIVLGHNRIQTMNAVRTGVVGGQIRVRNTINEQSMEITNAGVNIRPTEASGPNAVFTCTVDYNGEEGKVISLTLPMSLNQYAVKLDGNELPLAVDIDDALNPNEAKFYREIDHENNEVTYHVSVPSWSEHTITIYEIVEALTGPTAVMLYAAFGVVASILFLIPAYKANSPTIKLRKKEKKQ